MSKLPTAASNLLELGFPAAAGQKCCECKQMMQTDVDNEENAFVNATMNSSERISTIHHLTDDFKENSTHKKLPHAEQQRMADLQQIVGIVSEATDLEINRKQFLFVGPTSQTSTRQTLHLLKSVVTSCVGLALSALINSSVLGVVCFACLSKRGSVSTGTADFVVGVDKKLLVGSGLFKNCKSLFGTQSTVFGSGSFDHAD